MAYIRRHALAATCIALFLVVVGARWSLVARQGSDVPFWDQWSEWVGVFAPYYEGKLSLSQLVAPHNEHRLLFTRLLALGLFLGNGQWDPRLQMAVNAVLYALVACMTLVIFARGATAGFRTSWFAVLAVVFSLPFGWENTLAAFQSAFYFLAAFSVAAIWLQLEGKPFSPKWWMGIAFGIGALFTMASGILATAAVLAAVVAMMVRNRGRFVLALRSAWPTVAACALVMLAGLIVKVRVEGNVQLAVTSLGEFRSVLAGCLAWPLGVRSEWFVVWAPFIVFFYRYVSGRGADGTREHLILGFGAWVWLQAAAIAFSRGKISLASRYEDLLSFGLLVNVVALAAFWSSAGSAFRVRATRLLLVAWLVVMCVGLYNLPSRTLARERGAAYRVESYRTAAFVALGDYRALTGLKTPLDIPLPVASDLARLLGDPRLRHILPVGERQALEVQPVKGFRGNLAPGTFDPQTPSPYPWEPRYQFGGKDSEDFEVVVRKQLDVPVLSFFVSGDTSNVSVSDESGARHKVRLTGEWVNSPGAWQRAYAFCPGAVCRLSGRAPGTIAVAAPKEMGLLSLAALAGTGRSSYLLAVGVVLGLFVAGFTTRLSSRT